MTSPPQTTHHMLRMCCMMLVGLGAMSQMACVSASAQQKQTDQLNSMQSRLEEVERTNGRLTVRVEELEDQLFLVNDRVEAHRIALQRRGYMGSKRLAMGTPRRPEPTPETYYAPNNEQGVRTRRPQRTVTRIPLQQPNTTPTRVVRRPAAPVQRPAKAEKEVVYTESQYKAFAAQQPAARRPRPSKSVSSTGRAPQPNVTEERLSPNKGVATAPSSRTKPSSSPLLSKRFAPTTNVKPRKTGLAGYRESLAQYRAGNYKEALGGFKAFLASKPKEDYVDNALYWIGECQYGLGNFTGAVRYFKRVVNEQPDGNKVPDAMLKMSLAYERLGKSKQAKSTLKSLSSRYPLTNAGRAGKKRLSQLP